LAHEFGHALGLKHNDNPQAIMYRLMQSDSLNLAPDDIAALKERCSN
ncbi:MAG: matrixin family metalloprotease, partial [Syntrophales bacterium]